jgi:5'-nucleotidase
LKILVTNDDGIHAEGLWTLVEELRKVGEIVVSAPDREQSGVGTAISLNHPVRATEVQKGMDGVTAYAIEGTPADSAILALEALIEDPVDLVVSGINRGANMGNDVLISGTMGAALQGFFRGVPSLAVSVAALQDVHYYPAAKVARILAQSVADKKLSSPLLLNINVPNQPIEKIKGVSITRLGRRTYMDVIKENDDGRKKYYWISREKPGWILEKGLDIWSIRRKRISITPLHIDLINTTNSKDIGKAVKDVRKSILVNE